MAFSDPIAYAYGIDATATSAGTAANWHRVGDGIYVPSGIGSADEPYRLVIKNGPPVDNNRPTRFEVQIHRDKNAPVAGLSVASLPTDDHMVVGMYANYVPRSFAELDVYNAMLTAAFFCRGNYTKLYRGEK